MPPYRIVFYYFRLWQRDGTWDTIHDKLRERVRRQAGKTLKPTAAILDSQSVKTTEQGGPKGYDAGKKIGGAYASLARWAMVRWLWVVELVKRPTGNFPVLPKRWIVERTFGWLNRSRRLAKS